MRIGIIGSGIAGLSAGRFLNQAGHQVVLVERLDQLGMSAHGIEFEIGGKVFRGDVPSRMFNGAQWPNLLKIYQQVGVEFEPVRATQSFSDVSGKTYLHLNLPYRFEIPTSIFRSRPRRILSDMRRLKIEGEKDLLSRENLATITLRDYLNENEYTSEFIDGFLYPVLSSTVCTCSYSSLDGYPAVLILEAIRNIAVEQSLFKTRFGTHDVTKRLSDGCALRTGSTVQQISEHADQVRLEFLDQSIADFDHVIIATQANHAARFFENFSSCVSQSLRDIQYEDVRIIVHRDPALMPKRRDDWSTFNMLVGKSASMCTVWMNQFHSNWELSEPIFQTIGPIAEPDPTLVLHEITLQRPIVDLSTVHRLDSIENYHQTESPKVWLCGSYATEGIPLLETGVVSANRIAQSLSCFSQPQV